MSAINKAILLEYSNRKADYEQVEIIASEKLKDIVETAHIPMMLLQHRVKEKSSLEGKLLRTEGKYSSLSDLTDILGVRMVCFFSDDIDVLGSEIEKAFTVDRENTTDKRKNLAATSFGYLSMHYICSLKESDEYPASLCGLKFEIQIRTALQHVWSEMEHDVGYKSEFGLPRELVRSFSRVAGLLELCDDQFIYIRDGAKAYNQGVIGSIRSNDAAELGINTYSLNEYIRSSTNMQSFLTEIAAISGADIVETSSINYVKQLEFLNVTTLGELDAMLERCRDAALKLAKKVLEFSELDILSSVIGLRFLCRAELLMNYDIKRAEEFMSLTAENKEQGRKQAELLFRQLSVIK